jgi:threonine dehydrogenase-like Zn-dependent dehydrogenase
MAKMKAVVLEATVNTEGRASQRGAASQRLSYPRLLMRNVPEPQLLDDDDLIVEVMVNGICGSDTHVSEAGANGYVKFSGPANAPVVLGHEFVGRVVARGKGVSRLGQGEIVAAESIQACRVCRWCREGHFNQCEKVELIGLTIDGGLARYVRVKEVHCHPVTPILERFGGSRGISLAALLEPLGCAFCGLFIDHEGKKWNGVKPGDIAAVFGAGPIGLGAVALLKAAGAEQVLAFDVNDERVELAKKLGATAAYNISKFDDGGHSLDEVIKEHTRGSGLDVAVEAAGAPGLFADVLNVLGPRARFVYLGRTLGDVACDPNLLVTNAITIKGSRGHAGYNIFPSLIQMIAEGRLNLDGFVTTHYDFADALAAFERARAQRDGKILIHLGN